MTDSRSSAPDPIGDIVAGDVPVPITVWHVPPPAAGETLSAPLAQRLVANFTDPRRLVVDLTVGDQLSRAVRAARRFHVRHQPDDLRAGTSRARLVVVHWPLSVTPAALLADCVTRLASGGCVVTVLEPGDLAINQELIAAAAACGLRYLQHIIAAHELSVPRGVPDGRHVRAHRDVLVFLRPMAG